MRDQKYVMVPVDVLKDAVEVIGYIDSDSHNPPTVDYAKSLLTNLDDLLAASPQAPVAPAAQGEQVSLRQRLFSGWQGCSNHGCVVVDPKPGMMRTNGTCQCVVNASRSQLYLLQGRIQTALNATHQPAEQQPAPDVAALVEALEGLMRLESRGRIMPVGAEWDAARTALAAHQKRRDQ